MTFPFSPVTDLAHLGDMAKQDTAPASPSDLDVWLDTSQDPPEWKVWDDTAGEWDTLGGGSGGSSGGGGRKLIGSAELSTSDTIDISGVPSSYTDLLLVVEARSTNATGGDAFRMQLGGSSIDTGNNYSWAMRETGDADNEGQEGGVSGIGPPSTGWGAPFTAANATSDLYGICEFRFRNYADTTRGRHVVFEGGRWAGGGNSRRVHGHGYWDNTADAIEQIKFRSSQDTTWAAGSRWWLYGITSSTSGAPSYWRHFLTGG